MILRSFITLCTSWENPGELQRFHKVTPEVDPGGTPGGAPGGTLEIYKVNPGGTPGETRLTFIKLLQKSIQGGLKEDSRGDSKGDSRGDSRGFIKLIQGRL